MTGPVHSGGLVARPYILDHASANGHHPHMRLHAINNEAPLVSTDRLTKYYQETLALENLTLHVKPGEVLGLLGPNGAGKTTAIHIMLGLLRPSSGEVTILGLSPFTHRQHILPRINFSSAYVQLPSNLKVDENLRTYARLYGVKKFSHKIEELVTLFEMGHLLNRVTGALSSGERTRLNLCKALLNDPILLLLDEPTSSLDPEMADRVRTILQEIQKRNGLGMIYTSHNMEEVERMCDRIVFIHRGRVMAQGGHSELKAKFGVDSLNEVFIQLVRNRVRGDT